MKLSDFKIGASVGGIKIGMTVHELQNVLGYEDSRYPVGREYDPVVDDEHFLCWKKKGIEVGVDALDGEGLPSASSRVVAIHVKGQEITDEGGSVNSDAIVRIWGEPTDASDYTVHGGRRRTLCCYNNGLQATYDEDGWLVSLAVTKVKVAKRAAPMSGRVHEATR